MFACVTKKLMFGKIVKGGLKKEFSLFLRPSGMTKGGLFALNPRSFHILLFTSCPVFIYLLVGLLSS